VCCSSEHTGWPGFVVIASSASDHDVVFFSQPGHVSTFRFAPEICDKLVDSLCIILKWLGSASCRGHECLGCLLLLMILLHGARRPECPVALAFMILLQIQSVDIPPFQRPSFSGLPLCETTSRFRMTYLFIASQASVCYYFFYLQIFTNMCIAGVLHDGGALV